MKNVMKQLRHCFLVAAFGLLGCLLFSTGTEAATTGKVYISVEKFTIGQGYLIEPCEVTFTEGEKVSQITDRVLKANGYDYQLRPGQWFLDNIVNADSGVAKVPECIKKKWGNNITTNSDKDLGTFDYASLSGWCYYYNNNLPNVLSDECVAHDGDVIRWRFTLFNGTLGSDDLPLPNLDSLTKSMAIFNANKQLCVEKGYQAAYNEALSFASNMDAHYIDEGVSGHTKKEIEAKIQSLCSKLPTEATINQWKLEKAAAQQAAAQQAAAQAEEARKVALYTPAVPTLKSVKSTKTRTAVITWKKNKKATGYEIYMSTKKASGYKKITTVKSWKKVTYTKKKLKKNKKYYFKVRAYKTAEGKKYYSAYSKVKAVKVK